MIKIPNQAWDYAIRGFLDGIIATLGVVIGARNAASAIIIAAGISGGVANSLSNLLAAFSAQKSSILQDLNQIEDAMVATELENTEPYRRSTRKVQVAAIMDGGATIFGASVPVIPYLFFQPTIAMYVAIGVTALLSFWVGVIMGKLSKRSVLYLGFKLAILAIVVAAVSTLLQSTLHSILSSGI